METDSKKDFLQMARLMQLLLSPAIEAPGAGWRISGMGLLIIAGVMVFALAKVPRISLGSAATAGVISKLAKRLHGKHSARTSPPEIMNDKSASRRDS